MRPFLLPALLLATLLTVRAQTADIRHIDKSRAGGWAEVDGGWIANPDILVTQFTLQEDFPGNLPVSAYFFNEARQLVYRYTRLPMVQIKSAVYQEALSNLRAGQRYEAAFPIPPSVDANGPLRWRTFVIQIGDGDTPTRRAYPGSTTDLAAFDFKQKPVRGIGDVSTEAGAIEAVPVIKSITRFRNPMNAWVDDKWTRGLNTLRVKVRLDSGAAQGGFVVRAYFFDRNGSRILQYKKPPQVEVSGGKYATLPTIWQDKEDYEILFPIPDSIDRGTSGWKSAVIVFGNSKALVADVTPASASIDLLDFPEKADLLAKKP